MPTYIINNTTRKLVDCGGRKGNLKSHCVRTTSKKIWEKGKPRIRVRTDNRPSWKQNAMTRNRNNREEEDAI